MESSSAWHREAMRASARKRLLLVLASLALVGWLLVAVDRIGDEDWLFAGCAVVAFVGTALRAREKQRHAG